MEMVLTAFDGSSTGTLQLTEAVFDRPFNEGLIHQAVVACLANARSDTVGHKNRAAKRGGGRKPWRQKGTGRARAGTIRSPLWRGGGKTFVANDRDHGQKINRKMYRAAMRSILSELTRQGRIVALSELSLPVPKTRELANKLDNLGAAKALIVIAERDENLLLASRNLRQVQVALVSQLDPATLVGADRVLMTQASIQALEGQLQ